MSLAQGCASDPRNGVLRNTHDVMQSITPLNLSDSRFATVTACVVQLYYQHLYSSVGNKTRYEETDLGDNQPPKTMTDEDDRALFVLLLQKSKP